MEKLAPLRLTLEAPTPVVIRGMPLSVGGWVLATRPIAELAIWLDGRLLGYAELGLPRPGVAAAFPEYPNGASSGFRFNDQSPHLELADEIEILVEVRFSDGGRLEHKKTFKVAGLDEAISGIGSAFPRLPSLYMRLANALVAAQRNDDAEKLLTDATDHFPDVLHVRARHAQAAVERREWDCAAARWTRVKEQWPDNVLGHLNRAKALLEAQRLDEAEAAFQALMERFPVTKEIRFHYGRLGEAKAEANFTALLSARRVAETPRQKGEIARKGETGATTPAQLMSRFCSLGFNCEFGYAQRQCGAEPLDLLRWGLIRHEALLEMLRQRFDKFGDPELLSVYPTDYNELMVKNTRYSFAWHSFKQNNQITEEQLLQRELPRIPLLAELLVDNLTDGSRIFVRIPQPAIPEEQGGQLLKAIRAYGMAPLLFVTVADASHPDGTVEWLGDGLLHGYIERLADHANVPGTTAVANWLRLCETAAKLVDEHPAA